MFDSFNCPLRVPRVPNRQRVPFCIRLKQPGAISNLARYSLSQAHDGVHQSAHAGAAGPALRGGCKRNNRRWLLEALVPFPIVVLSLGFKSKRAGLNRHKLHRMLALPVALPHEVDTRSSAVTLDQGIHPLRVPSFALLQASVRAQIRVCIAPASLSTSDCKTRLENAYGTSPGFTCNTANSDDECLERVNDGTDHVTIVGGRKTS